MEGPFFAWGKKILLIYSFNFFLAAMHLAEKFALSTVAMTLDGFVRMNKDSGRHTVAAALSNIHDLCEREQTEA